MLKIGLECEYLICNTGTPNVYIVVPAGIPADECGLLVEARGQPSTSIEEAVFSLKADIYRLAKLLEPKGIVMTRAAIGKIDRNTRLEAARQYTKGLIRYANLYGHKAHRNSLSEQTAGIHVSFTRPEEYVRRENERFSVNTMFDWVKIFKHLDAAFADEIKAAKRRPGFYELKNDGRIEYRSLPNNVNLDKLIEVLKVAVGQLNFSR